MTTRRKQPKDKSAGISLNAYLPIAGITGAVLICYIAYRASISDRRLFHAIGIKWTG